MPRRDEPNSPPPKKAGTLPRSNHTDQDKSALPHEW
jgi:hypothetical protein